jgi:hypothetical protein
VEWPTVGTSAMKTTSSSALKDQSPCSPSAIARTFTLEIWVPQSLVDRLLELPSGAAS